jgi:HSP20 family molecular chaperone IbpA
MTRLSPFSSPLLLGFDQLERMLDHVAKNAGDGYPPYNIVQLGTDRLRITLAVAGFAEAELEVTIENRQLHIRGAKGESAEEGVVYLYRGIAARQFQRTFLLADGIEVRAANLDNGLLHIELARPVAPATVRSIAISSARSAGTAEDARANGQARRGPDGVDSLAENTATWRVVRVPARERSNT